MRSLLLTLLFLALAAPALASDGVLEINQTCAVQTGCFPGDDAGFPVTISSRGSYLLTGNLSVTDADANGISIEANGVAIDLRGFEIVGPVDCTGSGSTVVCSAGIGRGIIVLTGFGETQVRRGAIRGFGSFGVHLRRGAIAENLTVARNGGSGLGVDSGSVSRCTASNNGNHGIEAFNSSINGSVASFNKRSGISMTVGTAIGNVAQSNGEHGYLASFGRGNVQDNVASFNEDIGIRCGQFNDDGCVIAGNTVVSNQGGGILGVDAVVVRNNSIFDNGGDGVALGFAANVDGNTLVDNSGNGISVNSGSLVASNVMRTSGGFGLFFFGSQSAYRGNTISENTGGTVGFGPDSSAVNTGSNVCDGSLTCP